MPFPKSSNASQKKKIAMVGNSQLAALKTAMSEGLFSTEQFDFIFWGQPGKHFATLRLVNGNLVFKNAKSARTVSGGRYSKLPISQMDAFVFHGVSSMNRRFITALLASGMHPGDMSSAFLTKIFAEQCETQNSPKLVLTLREATDVPIFVSGLPYDVKIDRRVRNPKARLKILRKADVVVEKFWNGKGINYISQPEETISPKVTTPIKYTFDAVSLLDNNHTLSKLDINHMNSEYGAAVLRKVDEVLNEHL